MPRRGVSIVVLALVAPLLAGCHPHPTIFSVSASNTQPLVGEQVTFSVRADRSRTDSLMWMEWDFDGDGTYESGRSFFGDPQFVKSISNTYTTPGPVRPSVLVFEEDPRAWLSIFAKGGAKQDLSLTVLSPSTSQPANQAPSAFFSASPDPASVERAVTFDASGSSDPDGTIARYEWDFDGDGTFEVDTGTTPTATHTYEVSGTYRVGLRVTDNAGVSAKFERDLVVRDELSPKAQAASTRPGFAAGLPRFSIALRGVPVLEGMTRVDGGVLSITGQLVRGRTRFRGAGPLPRTVARYALSHDFVAPISGASVEVRGVLLVRFRPGRTACFQLAAAGPADGAIRAGLEVLGGSGALTRLRGSGAFTSFPSTRGKVTIPGRGRFAIGRGARRLPRACRALNRQLRG